MIYARGNPAKWWTSRSCGIASRAPASIGGIGNFRKLSSVSTLGALVLIVFAVWYVTNPARVGRLAETLLTNVFGGPVTVKKAHLSISGTLLLSGVELHTEISPNSPHPLPVFSADQIEVRFDWLSLISGRLSATQLTAVKPTLFLVEDPATNRWNYERLRTAPPAADNRRSSASAAPALPVVILRTASIQWCELHEGRIEQTGQTIVDGQLVPEPGNPVYYFQVVRHGDESPRLSSSGPNAALVTGTWDIGGNRFSAAMDKIALTDDIKIILPRSVRKWWDEHHLQGSLSRLQMSFDNNDGLVLDVTSDGVSFVQDVQPEPAEGGGPPEMFPVAFNNLRGAVRLGVTKPSLQLKHLTGEVMTFAFSADADFRGLSPESPFDLALQFKNARLSHDYPPLFMASLPVQDLLQRISPWGNFNMDLSLKRLSWSGEIFLEGNVACNHANMRFCHFPFPLHDVTGKIHFDNELVRFEHVTARADEAHVAIEGVVGATPARPIIDLTVSSDDAAIDDRMGACLPEQYKAVWDQFAIRGHGKFVCKANRPATALPTAEPTFNVAVDLESAAGYVKMFPYRVTGATGRLVFTADQTLVQNLTMHSGDDHSGTVTFNGAVKHPHGDVSHLMPDLTLAADVPIDREFTALLPADVAEKLKDMELAGRVGFTGTIRRTAETAADVPAEIVGDLMLKNGSLKVPAKQLVLNDLAAKGHVATASITGIEISAATPEGLHLGATGTADLGVGGASFKVTAEGKEIVIPADAPAALPENARAAWSSYKPVGSLDISAWAEIAVGASAATQSAASAPATQAAPAYAVKDWSLTMTPRPLALSNASWPEPIHDITGKITADPGKIVFENIRGVSGPVSLGLNGSYNFASGNCVLSGAAIAEQPPTQWYGKLPAGLAEFLEVNKPSGQFQVTVEHLERAASDSPWVFDGTLSASDIKTNGPATSVALGAGKLSANVKGLYDVAAGGLDMTGSLASTDFSVSGKNVDTLTAAIAASAADKSLKLTNIDGKAAGGSLHGSITATFNDNPGYQGELTLSDAALSELMLPKNATDEDRKKIGTGRVTATLALQQTYGDVNGKGADRTGRGDLVVRDGKIYNVPLAMGLMQIATLRLPVSKAFDQASMTYYIRDNKVTFEKILLESPGINLGGNGTLSLKTVPPTLDLSFVTESPHEMQIPVITEFVRGTRNELLQVSVTGPTDNPKVAPVPFNPLMSTLQAILPHRNRPEKP